MVDHAFSYQGKVAVVTGASRGIGLAVLETLAKRGCHTVAIARPSAELDRAVGGLKANRLTASSYPCDLNDLQSVAELGNALREKFNRIDILVNCAGVGKLGPIQSMSAEDVVAPVKVPLLSTISLTHELLPGMINHGDSQIINIITPAAYFDLPYMAPYTASRSGLLSFTRSLDEELKQQGIRVKSVCPAWVDTDYLKNNQTDGDWYPKVSCYFPTISTRQAANCVIDAIEGQARELKPALLLKLFELGYRWFPRLSILVFKCLNLYHPGAIEDSGKNRQGGHSWTNWEESISLKPAKVAFPESIEEVMSVVVDVNNYPSPLRAAGSRHTTTHCGVAENGTLMIMRKMDKIVHIDTQNYYVTVQAGALYIDVAKALHKQGLQFFVNVEIGNLTMGSAACTGTKDASMPGEYGQVCSYCTGVKLVLADGSLRIINEDEPELLSAVRSSYGLFGVIVETTFAVKPVKAMSVRHQRYTLDEFERALPELRKGGDSMMYYLFPFQNTLTVEFRRYRPKKPSKASCWLWWLRNFFWKTCGPRVSYLATTYINNKAIRYRLIDGFYTLISVLVSLVLSSQKTVATDQIIRYPEHKNASKYTFSIWAFDEKNIMPIMRAYFKFCQDYYRDNGFRCDMLNVGYRISEDKNPMFSYSYNNTVMTLDPVTTGAPGWDDFLNAYNEFCSANGGVPLFNQSKWLTRDQVQSAFGDRIDRFWQIKQDIDPTQRFLNHYFKELLEPDSSH